MDIVNTKVNSFDAPPPVKTPSQTPPVQPNQNQPTPNPPTAPNQPIELTEEDIIKNINKAAKGSLDDIISSVEPNTQFSIPLGNNPPNQNTPAPPTIPGPKDPIGLLDDLENEINTAQIDKNRSPESIGSFEGLKTRYKNKVAAFKTEYEKLQREIEENKNKLTNFPNIEAQAKKAQELEAKYNSLKLEAEAIKKENDTLSYYRKKYDLENDPHISAGYTKPMNELRTRAMDILSHNGLDDSYWKELLAADSEFKINSLIENSNIGGLNAQSLKSYVINYRNLDHEFKQVSSPEYIDSAITTARGKTLEYASAQASEVFSNIKTAFEAHIEELKENPINKEHNFYIHDKVVDQATKNYESLKKTIDPQYSNKSVLGALAQTALMTAAYPVQNQMLKHLLKVNQELAKELAEHTATPGISQTSEPRIPQSTDFGDINAALKRAASATMEDIISSSFSNK